MDPAAEPGPNQQPSGRRGPIIIIIGVLAAIAVAVVTALATSIGIGIGYTLAGIAILAALVVAAWIIS